MDYSIICIMKRDNSGELSQTCTPTRILKKEYSKNTYKELSYI